MPRTKKPFPGSKLFLSFGFIVASIGYALWMKSERPILSPVLPTGGGAGGPPAGAGPQNPNAGPQNAGPKNAGVAATTGTVSTGTSAGSGMGMMGNGPRGPMHTGFTDGTYVGSAADAYYGMVQVQAIIQSGKITDVQFLQYPSDRSTSRYINSQAMPLLTQEAIQVQNAQVSGVSGATETTLAFRKSLASALAQAH